MTTEEKLALIKEVGEEIITEEELRTLFESGDEIIAYDGYEPSGQMHIAQGLLRAININKLTKTGMRVKMLVADWHAMANNKMGGDLEKIKTVGRYFIEVWKACGLDMKSVEFVWASDLVKNANYWLLVLKIAKTNSYRRFLRTAEIMGRADDENLTAANILYSCMQTADIFTLGARVTQLGMDQRKINVLAREIGPQLGPPAGGWKPVIVSHHMLRGLTKPDIATLSHGHIAENQKENNNVTMKQFDNENKLSKTIALKMSKSNPDSAIFMTDTPHDVERKVTKAWCPEGVIEDNPILEYCRYILFEKFPHITIKRPEKFGAAVKLTSYEELEKKFAAKEIHPQDLKQTVAKLINELLDPVRKHFEENAEAKALLQEVRSFQVTR